MLGGAKDFATFVKSRSAEDQSHFAPLRRLVRPYRNQDRQHYCSKLDCRHASKQASQQRWLADLGLLRILALGTRRCGCLLSEKSSPSEILLTITRFDRATMRGEVQTKIREGLRHFTRVT